MGTMASSSAGGGDTLAMPRQFRCLFGPHLLQEGKELGARWEHQDLWRTLAEVLLQRGERGAQALVLVAQLGERLVVRDHLLIVRLLHRRRRP